MLKSIKPVEYSTIRLNFLQRVFKYNERFQNNKDDPNLNKQVIDDMKEEVYLLLYSKI